MICRTIGGRRMKDHARVEMQDTGCRVDRSEKARRVTRQRGGCGRFERLNGSMTIAAKLSLDQCMCHAVLGPKRTDWTHHLCCWLQLLLLYLCSVISQLHVSLFGAIDSGRIPRVQPNRSINSIIKHREMTMTKTLPAGLAG